jgi:hypothetical protein
MNAPVEVHQHLLCNNAGSGRYLDASVKLDHRFISGQDSALVEKLDVNKHVDLKNMTNAKYPCHVDTKRMPQIKDTTTSTSDSTSKGVRFILDRKGRVCCEIIKTRERRTKQEIADCWYTQGEFKQFRRACKEEVISQAKTNYRKYFAAVYDACAVGSFKGVTKERAYISAASCRGLEVVVYPTLHSDRKIAIATVLKTQASLPVRMSADVREETLASAGRFLSKQARQLARVLGSGDAAVVVANNRLAALQSSKGVVPHCFISS